jgi:hypothetical protein
MEADLGDKDLGRVARFCAAKEKSPELGAISPHSFWVSALFLIRVWCCLRAKRRQDPVSGDLDPLLVE